MSVWKEIRVQDIMNNKNDLDINKMYKAGAINGNTIYKALEIELYEEFEKYWPNLNLALKNT